MYKPVFTEYSQSEIGIEIIEIVTVGKREDDEVYEIAAKRLGRY